MSREVFGRPFTSYFLFLLLVASRVFTGEPPEVRVGFQTPSEPPPPYRETHPTPPPPAATPTVTGGQLLKEAVQEIAGVRPGPQQSRQASQPPLGEAATTPPSSGVEGAREQVPAFTVQEAAQPAEERPGTEASPIAPWQGPSTIRIVVSLVVVLGMVAAVLYGLKRFQHSRLAAGGSTGLLQVLARTYLEPGRSILLVKAPGRILIVGSSREGLSRLAEITDKKEVEEILRSAGQGKRSDAFAEILGSKKWDATGEETA